MIFSFMINYFCNFGSCKMLAINTASITVKGVDINNQNIF